MLKGKRLAAILLYILGTKYSEKVLDHLPRDVSDVIADVLSKEKKKPFPEEISEVIEEFNGCISEIENKEAELARKRKLSPIELITASDPTKIAEAVKEERPEFVAFVLSHMAVEKIYEILPLLGNIRQEVEERLLHMKDVPITQIFQDKVLDIVAKKLI